MKRKNRFFSRTVFYRLKIETAAVRGLFLTTVGGTAIDPFGGIIKAHEIIMAKSKRNLRFIKTAETTSLNLSGTADGASPSASSGSAAASAHSFGARMLSLVRGRWWIFAMIGVLSLSALGAGLKYLEAAAARQISERNRATFLAPAQESALSKVNPFLASASATPTPQLSKEYVYAGSRMLAVEDAAAVNSSPADIAVWRPSSGEWFMLVANNNLNTFGNWGMSGDIPVPGDYDGDGRTDLAVYRPSNNYFYILRSSDASYQFVQFGAPGDRPVPADYDGDHKTDIAVYRPRSGSMPNAVWYILKSTDQTVQYVNFGDTNEVPAPADYDGDGKAEAAIYRPANNNFYYFDTSANQFQAAQLGSTPGAAPVPADYDGDGKADCAVREGANWIIYLSATLTVQTISWQQAGDIAVQNDYDGDGKVDLAVWRPSGAQVGTWYIRQSSKLGQSNELRQELFGATGDVPVPAFWRR